MKKEIIVHGIKYEFFLDEAVNMWRIIDNNFLVDNCAIDLEVDIANFNGSIEWINIEKFIQFIRNDKQKVNQNVKDAQSVLLSFFKTINGKIYDEEFLNNINFILSGIDYKGFSKNVNLSRSIEYDYFFFPQYTKDIYCDVGSFVWRAHFRDNLFLGVYCDRI